MANEETYFLQFVRDVSQIGISDMEAFLKEMKRHIRFFPQYEPIFKNNFGFYILSYQSGKYVHVNDTIAWLAGRSLEQMLSEPVPSFSDSFHKQDAIVHDEKVFKENVRFISKIPIEDHKRYLMSSNYRIHTGKGLINVTQDSYFIKSAPNGTPLATLGVIRQSNCSRENYVINHKIYLDNNVVLNQNYVPGISSLTMTTREKEIIQLKYEGFPAKEIATNLGIKVSTVNNIIDKFRRRFNLINKSVKEINDFLLANGLVIKK